METINGNISWHICEFEPLPPLGKTVLVCCVNKKGEPFVRAGKRDKGRWLIPGTIEGIYAWADLPSVPPTVYMAVPCRKCRHHRYSREHHDFICEITQKVIPDHPALLCQHFI